MYRISIIAIVSIGLFSATALSEELRFESGEERVALLELFTSQSCSSCPPAERWFNGFENDPRLWKKIVPVAFHVDYWDRLGWKDPFASFENTSRQYLHRKEGNVASVYTPGFVLNGKEWRGWFERSEVPESDNRSGNLSIEVKSDSFAATYSKFSEDLRLHVVLLGIDLRTKVMRGENRNRDLRQSFVALSQKTYASENGKWQGSLPMIEVDTADRYGLAVWLTRAGSLEPLQATGGWLKIE